MNPEARQESPSWLAVTLWAYHLAEEMPAPEEVEEVLE